MIAQFLLSAVALAASPPEAGADAEILVGKVRVVGTAQLPQVRLRVEGDQGPAENELKLTGDLVSEVARLQSAVVEVTGKREGDRFVVQYYYILDVGGGVEPAVGTLVALAGGMLGLSDGAGEPIPLSIRPRSQQPLAANVGAKLWVHGRELVSGQLKVLRYGILRSAAPATAAAAQAVEPSAGAQPMEPEGAQPGGEAEAVDSVAAGVDAEKPNPD